MVENLPGRTNIIHSESFFNVCNLEIIIVGGSLHECCCKISKPVSAKGSTGYSNPLMKTLFFNISTDFQLLWLIDLTTKSALVQ